MSEFLMFISGPIVILDSSGRGDPVIITVDVTEPTTSVSSGTTSTYVNPYLTVFESNFGNLLTYVKTFFVIRKMQGGWKEMYPTQRLLCGGIQVHS